MYANLRTAGSPRFQKPECSSLYAHKAPTPEPIDDPLPGEHPVPQEAPVPSPHPEVVDSYKAQSLLVPAAR